jgi:hypothetical protein
MFTALLIVHGLLAVLLLGAITHQALAVLWPSSRGGGFFDRVRGVSGLTYTQAVIALFVVTFIIGAVIYPSYRLNVRPYLSDYRLFAAAGAFEVKEHIAAMALALLPLYFVLWRGQVVERAHAVARGAVTAMIALAAWTSFFVGHILNNIRGLFGT